MKSKIEQKIKNAREATNEMFAAFDELNERLSEKLQPEFKVGDYLTMINAGGDTFLGILRYELRRGNGGFKYYAGINRESEFATYDAFGFQDDSKIDFSTPEEIALLDSKLAEQGKRFDKEKLELVDIPKHKEPIIGEMVIGWENHKNKAIIGVLKEIYYPRPNSCIYNVCEKWLTNAILFESVEQYKAFLKS